MPDFIRPSANHLRGPKQNAVGRPKQKKKKPASLKNQIRAIERLSRKEGLDARIRKKEQARLQQLREAAEARKAQELERKYAVRYHKIRFFERVKIERRIKQLERELKCVTPSTDSSTHAKLAQAEEDLQYVVNFPKGEKYVSLLRNAEDPKAQKVLEAERKRLRIKMQQQLADIAMITQADEGNLRLHQQPLQPLASPHLDQNMPRPSGAKARPQAPEAAALSKQVSERKPSSADLPERLLLKSSEPFPVVPSQASTTSHALLSKASRQTAGVPGTAGGQQKGMLAAGGAVPDNIDEDDFFMSSSTGEVEQVEQPAGLTQPSGAPGAMPHKSGAPEQQHEASEPVPQKQKKQRKDLHHRRRLPPGQDHAERGLKSRKRAALPSLHKAIKPLHKDLGAVRPAVHGKLRVYAPGQPSRGQPHGEALSAGANNKCPGAPEKRPGLPLRTRAEGGRKRRKKT